MLFVLLCALKGDRPDAPLARREFGFSLNPTAQGDLFALFIYTVHDGRVVDSRPMRKGPYILQMAGLEESPANIESLDLFEEYGITHCGAWSDANIVHPGLDCAPLSDLWKLRYRADVVNGEGAGWAGEEHRPSDRQQILLQAYRPDHYTHWHGPYFGKDAMRLLRDMQDPGWIRLYQDGG